METRGRLAAARVAKATDHKIHLTPSDALVSGKDLTQWTAPVGNWRGSLPNIYM